MARYDIAIVGAGLAGLTCASLLAKRGLKVAVIDKNFKPGGSCGIFKRNESTFEQGTSMLYGFGGKGFNPHYFVFNCLEENIDIIKHDLLYSVIYDGKKIRFWEDTDRFVEELAGIFPSQKENLKRFYSDLKKMYYNVMIENPAYEAPDETNLKLALKKFIRHPLSYIKFMSYINKNTRQLLEKYFEDPEIFKFFNKLTSTYCYTTIEETPAILSAIMFINNHEGGSYFTAGSTLFLTGTLEKVIEENGGDMLYEHEAREIIIEGKRASGVRLDNDEIIKADNIIYSGTVWNLYEKLIDKRYSSEERRNWAKNIKPTYSSVVFFATIDASIIPEQTTPIEMIIGNPDSIDETEITVYIHSMDDKTLCPDDKHVIVAIGPSFKTWPDFMDPGYKTQKYVIQKEAEISRMLEVLEKNFPGFKKGVKFAELSSPTTIERYTLKNHGCVAGPKQSIGQHMFKRLHIKSEWSHLYCCGESTTMGTGSPAVTVSGISAANAILKKLGMEQFYFKPGMPKYVNLLEKPVTFEKLYSRYPEKVRGMMQLSSTCLFCEIPECSKDFNLDIRGILRRVNVSNFKGAYNIIDNFLKSGGNSINDLNLRNAEKNCVMNNIANEPVEIEKIIRFLIDYATLQDKKNIQT